MTDPTATTTSRDMWHLLEAIHAVVYFAPEVVDRYKALGLKGFWMGYFAGRSAPLGAASPELVAATFFNFHPDMVARALPDAWEYTTPEAAIDARHAGVDEALRRILGDDMLAGPAVAEVADLVTEAIRGCSVAGRPMYAANTTLTPPATAHMRLWHGATLVREHRGDGHIAANLANGFGGIDAHITLCATGAVPRSSLQPHRGWSDDDWATATRRLIDSGILDEDEHLTDAGHTARAEVEALTDRLAAEPWDHLGPAGTLRLRELLEPIARTITTSGELPFPNPMALPDPGDVDR